MWSRNPAPIGFTARIFTMCATAPSTRVSQIWLSSRTTSRSARVHFGGPIKRNKAFFFLGFDQHVFHVPTVVEFDDGSDHCAPTGCGPGNARKRPETTKPAIRHWCSRRRLDPQVRQVNILRDSWEIAGFVKLDLNLTPKGSAPSRLTASPTTARKMSTPRRHLSL
jgi:hypothetical protein